MESFIRKAIPAKIVDAASVRRLTGAMIGRLLWYCFLRDARAGVT